MKFLKYMNSISWKNNLDKNIPFDVLNDINNIKCIDVVSTCSGHSKKGPSLYFKVNKKDIEYKTFSELKEIFDGILNNLYGKLDNTDMKWVCWLNPTEFLYDSDTGYNKTLLDRYNSIDECLCYKVIIQLQCRSKDTDWWYDVLDSLNDLKTYINDMFSIGNHIKFTNKKDLKRLIGMK